VVHVDLHSGAVTTVAGVAQVPGYEDLDGNGLTPCLNDPCDIVEGENPGELYLTDRGNHCVRRLRVTGPNPGGASLQTVAGDPAHAGTRWGLLRDSLPAPLPREYATLDHPCGIVKFGDSWYVTSGRCVTDLSNPGGKAFAQEAPRFQEGDGSPASVVILGPRSATGTTGGFHWWLEKVPQAGSGHPCRVLASGRVLAEQGQARIPLPPHATGSLRFRLVTDEGISFALFKHVEAQAEASSASGTFGPSHPRDEAREEDERPAKRPRGEAT
jgi:hypothetical protein